MKPLCFLGIWVLASVMGTSALWADSGTLSVQNDLVKIVINNESFDTGRFALETIGGNPLNLNDDEKPLIYGRPKPWTSFSTFKIDGNTTIFGGPTKKRAGKSGIFGKVMSQTILDNKMITVCQIEGLTITQSLALFNNPISGAKDAVLIEYQIENPGPNPRTVGARVMLDTMLGDNDGAPFRIGSDAVESEAIFSGNQILPFWQAFDDLASPNIIAQGILSSDDIELSKPSKMALVNWGTLADNPWDVPYQPGRSFVREGENVPDTALALYWPETPIPAGGRRVIRTAYGLGGLSVSAGDVRLGLTAPAKMFGTQNSQYLVIGYIQNAGSLTARNTVVSFDFPDGTDIISGATSLSLGDLKPGESRQIPVTIRVTNVAPGKHALILKVSSDTLKDNVIKREVQVVNPAQIEARLLVPKVVGNTQARHFPVEAVLKNNEQIPLTGITAKLSLSTAAEVARFDLAQKTVDIIQPNSSVSLNWMLRLDRKNESSVKATLSISGREINPKSLADTASISALKPDFGLRVTDITSSNYAYALIEMSHPTGNTPVQATIEYDPQSIRIQSIVQPQLLMAAKPDQSDGIIRFSPIAPKLMNRSDYIAKIRFLKTGKSGTLTLKINGQVSDIRPITAQLSGGSL